MTTPTSTFKFNRPPAALALLVLLAVCGGAFGATRHLQDIRVGTHRGYDRIVFQMDAGPRYSVDEVAQGKLSVKLRNSDPAEDFALPEIPDELDVIRSLEAYRLGKTDLEIEVLLKNRFYYTVFLLESPWRLVVDCSLEPIHPPADANKPAKTNEPDYIPGDRPIKTTFADANVDTTTDPPAITPPTEPTSEPETQPEPEPKLAASEIIEKETHEELPVEPDTTAELDPAKLTTILHHYYLALGDTPKAREFERHPELADDNGAEIDSIDYLARAVTKLFLAMPWLIFVIAFVFGIGGGFVALWIHSRFRGGLPAKPGRVETAAAPVPRSNDVAESLEKDIDSLEEAVKSEAPEPAAPAPEPEAPASVQPAAPDDEQVKETAMERRVKRVLELSKGGHDVQSIAKQLEMSQDEVKLILDLNPHSQ